MKATLLRTIVFILTVVFQLLAVSSDTIIKRELPAVKTDQPPTIDAVLNDVCWQDAPQATNFTDGHTKKPSKNQSVARLLYTDETIYVGIYLYDDMPNKIVARQTKNQTQIRGEDFASLSLDPFHTHQFADRNWFMVNPIGTKFAHLATGRAEKSEWIGLWKAAAWIVKDGWIVEMEIPWQMLDYPDTSKPIRMGINVDRWHQRTGEKSWWSNLGVNHFQENDGHWIDVLPPPRKRELKMLPYLIGGICETKTEEREPPVRVGADVRYEVTPQLRFVGAANPDFENSEQAVGGSQQIAEQLANSVLGTPLLRHTYEDPLPVNTRYSLPSADTLAQYVGTYTWVYRPNEETQITIEMKTDKLTIQRADGEAIPLIAIGSDVFMAPHGVPKPIHFVRDGKGNVNSLLSGIGGGLFQRRG